MPDEDAILREAMAIARSRRDPTKLAQHARAIGEARRGVPVSEEHKAKLREAQAARRERERAERAALGIVETPKEPKKPGRPRTKPEPDASAEKRGRGRPKKSDAQMTAQLPEASGNAPQSQE